MRSGNVHPLLKSQKNFLDNSVAFIGSRLGDSQLIRLSTEPVDSISNSFVIVIDTFPNLGPIRDIVLIDVDGQKQVIFLF